MLSPEEKAIVLKLAEGDKEVVSQAEAIYYKHVQQYVDEGKKNLEMNFLSEVFNVCPDFMLRSMYRKQLLAAK
jgi:hypothetical protein